jgi:hypothetical protein
MPSIALKHVNAFRDRHGQLRHYARVPGRKAVPLPGLPGSSEFMQAYAAALDGVSERRVHGAGSVGATVLAYLQSAAFHALRPASQRQRRSCLDEFVRSYGGQAIAKLEHRHVKMLLD